MITKIEDSLQIVKIIIGSIIFSTPYGMYVGLYSNNIARKYINMALISRYCKR